MAEEIIKEEQKLENVEGFSKLNSFENVSDINNLEIPKVDIFEILKLVSPGSPLRIAIDDIVKAKRGALIVIMNANFPNILEGGFKVNCTFTHQKLFELCKMD